MPNILVLVWVKPAFSRFSPVDHTWVTSYDNRKTPLRNISEVKAQNESYWYCRGDFHTQGGTPQVNDGYVYRDNVSETSANCLVGGNDSNSGGTINRYGIDGVCHQVTNQVLYPTASSYGSSDPLKSKKIRGYRASTAVFGRYGRRESEWQRRTIHCVPIRAYVLPPMSLLQQRLVASLPAASDELVRRIIALRESLLADIDAIGFRPREGNETAFERANELNDRINLFLNEVAELMSDYRLEYASVFGLNAGEKIDLIDPNFFEFPG